MDNSLIEHVGETVAEFIAGQLALRGILTYDARDVALIFATAALRLGGGSEEFFNAVQGNVAGLTFTPHAAPVEAVDVEG